MVSDRQGTGYAYDGYGRPTIVWRQIDGLWYAASQGYDEHGRVTTLNYPSVGEADIDDARVGFQVVNVYNDLGFLKEVRAGAGRLLGFTNEVLDKQLFWQADRYDISGQVDGSVFGNGLSYDRSINKYTGRVEVLTAGVGTGTTVQYHQYTYDTLGNVLSRVDAAVNRTESFAYDGLNRLTSHTVSGGTTVTVGYDSLGNITSKSDVGSYAYSGVNAGPHAVTQVTLNTQPSTFNSYSYDANGNMVNRAGQGIEWTSFNQIRKINASGAPNAEFWFGAARERVLQKHSNNTVTTYVGSLYEKVVHPGGLVEEKHYVMTPLGRTAVRTVRNNATIETRYLHQDALGSIAAVTTESGSIEKRFIYDAWGKRTTTVDAYPNTPGGKITRGYTDHEHLEDFGLIHMNGRIYDPVLGRFLSADRFVDSLADSQAYNRYSYVSNNPLKYTDPSGYRKFWDVVKQSFFLGPHILVMPEYWLAPKAFNQYYGQAAGIAVTAVVSYFCGPVVGGAAGGFVSGFSTSLLNGGSIGDAFRSGAVGAAVGAVMGAVTAGIGEAGPVGNNVWTELGRAAAHGTVGGIYSEATGGDFRHGFLAGFAGSIGGSLAPHLGLPGYADRSFSAIAARTSVAAVIGGTAAVLGGGKFANGAVTAAFQHLLNAEGPHILKPDDFKPALAFYDSRDPNMQRAAERYAGVDNAVPVSSVDGIKIYFRDHPDAVFSEIALFTHSGNEVSAGFVRPGGKLNVILADDEVWTVLASHIYQGGKFTFAGQCALGGNKVGQQYVDSVAAAMQRGIAVRAPVATVGFYRGGWMAQSRDGKQLSWEWYSSGGK